MHSATGLRQKLSGIGDVSRVGPGTYECYMVRSDLWSGSSYTVKSKTHLLGVVLAKGSISEVWQVCSVIMDIPPPPPKADLWLHKFIRSETPKR